MPRLTQKMLATRWRWPFATRRRRRPAPGCKSPDVHRYCFGGPELMKWWLAAMCCMSALAADGPRLTYSKSFPGSVPENVLITLDKSGAGVYQEGEKDDNPIHFQLAASEAAEIFGLAQK